MGRLGWVGVSGRSEFIPTCRVETRPTASPTSLAIRASSSKRDHGVKRSKRDHGEIHAFDAVLIALMNAVYADVAWHPVRLRGAAFADGYARRVCLDPAPPFVLVWLASAQVVQMGNRDARQALVARVAEHLVRTLHELLGGRPGQRAMQHIRLGQQSYVRCGIAVGKTPLGCAGLFR